MGMDIRDSVYDLRHNEHDMSDPGSRGHTDCKVLHFLQNRWSPVTFDISVQIQLAEFHVKEKVGLVLKITVL